MHLAAATADSVHVALRALEREAASRQIACARLATPNLLSLALLLSLLLLGSIGAGVS
ncbi:MAG: hypothetical protein AAFX50_02295 [Acidobacteriota bacterium]